MKIYLIHQNKERGYDTYDSAVVVAKSAQAARKTHPNGSIHPDWYEYNDSWPSQLHYVRVEYLGKAKATAKAGVVVASYNAG